MIKKIFSLLALLFLYSASVSGQAPARPSVAEVLDRVRAAVGFAALTRLEDGIEIDGRADFLELKGTFRWRFRPDGRLYHELRGPIGMSLRFDGIRGWVSNWAGLERRLELDDLESFQTEFWVISNRWLTPDGPFELTLLNDQSTRAQVELALKRKTGILVAQVSIDTSTWLPAKFKYRTPGKTQTWTFADYQGYSGIAVPRLVTSINESSITTFVLERVLRSTSSLDQFSLQPGTAINTEWNSEAAPQVEIKRARTGHLLVRPLIEGRSVGWFMLDSGAGAMIITPRVANQTGMEAFGKVPVRGVGGTIQSPFRRGKKFELGQLIIRNPLYVEIDFTAISAAIGEELAGLCGYDLFQRTIVTLDSAVPTLELRDPAKFKLEGGLWEEVYLDHNIPHIICRFEGDREDIFRLDTGADNTVSFHSPAVERYRLLEGRETRATRAGGVGGSVAVGRGKLSWFEIAGHRFIEPEVSFSMAKTGAFTTSHSAGNIGAVFLSRFRMVFNYPERKIALIQK